MKRSLIAFIGLIVVATFPLGASDQPKPEPQSGDLTVAPVPQNPAEASQVDPNADKPQADKADATAKAANPRIFIVDNGGAEAAEDLANIKQLIADGVLERVASLEYAGRIDAWLTLQPKAEAAKPTIVNESGGYGGGLIPVTLAPDPKWERAVRDLKKSESGASVNLRFYAPRTFIGLEQGVDASLSANIGGDSLLRKAVLSAFEAHGLKVAILTVHPTFGPIRIPEGREVFGLYVNESRSPSRIFNNIDDLVDVQFTPDDAGTGPRNIIVLAGAKAAVISNVRRGETFHKVVGIEISPEDGRALRALERRGTLEAIRRDSNEKISVSPEARQQIAEALAAGDPGSKESAVDRDAATASSTPSDAAPARSKKTPLIVYEGGNRNSPLLEPWAVSGLVERRLAPTGDERLPDDTLLIPSMRPTEVPRLRAALEEIAALDIPPLVLSLSDPFSSRGFGRPGIRPGVAVLTASDAMPPAMAGRILEILKSQGIGATGVRKPTVSLWFLKPSFAALSPAATAEFRKVLEELGVAKEKLDALPNVSTDAFFPHDLAISFRPEQSAQLLSWLEKNGMVLETLSAPADDRSSLSRSIRFDGADPAQSEGRPYVQRAGEWTWLTDVVTSPPGQIEVRRTLSQTERWRGEQQPRTSEVAYHQVRVKVEPGGVAIVNALASESDQLRNLVARASSFTPLLVIENHPIDQPPPDRSTAKKAEPKIVPPEMVSPIEMTDSRIRDANVISTMAPLFDAGPDESANFVTKPAQVDSAPEVTIIRLQNADAPAMAVLLSQIIRNPGFLAVAEERTNSIILTTSDFTSLETAKALMAELDAVEPPATASSGTKRSVADAASASGQPARRAIDELLNAKTKESRPLAELQKNYADHESAAAREAQRLRDFLAKRRPGQPDNDFAREEKERRQRLAEAVRQSFQARQELLSAELIALQAKIATTRQSLEQRSRIADEIVSQRVEDLLNPELKWESPSAVPFDGPALHAADPNARSIVPSPAPRVLAAPPGVPREFTERPFSPSFPARAGQPIPGMGQDQKLEATGSAPRKARNLEVDGLGAERVAEVFHDLGIAANLMASSSGKVTAAFASTDAEAGQVQAALDREKSARNAEDAQSRIAKNFSDLTGIWEPHQAEDMMGMGPGMGAAGMPGMPPGSTLRLVISGDLASLYDKNERKRLWQLTIGQPNAFEFTPLDDQPGMRGTFDNRWRLTILSLGNEGLKIERFRRTVPIVPPEWAKSMMEARGKRAASPAPPPPPPSVTLTTGAESDLFARLAGIWATPRSGGTVMGMEMDVPMGMSSMGGHEPFLAAVDFGLPTDGSPPPGLLAIHGKRVALYEGKVRKRLWSITVDSSDSIQARLNFIPEDGQAGMQGSYVRKIGELTLVSAGEEGPQIEAYRRVISVLPREWAAELAKGQEAPAPSMTGAGQGNELLKGITGGAVPRPTRRALSGDSGRNLSDYLELLNKYGAATIEYERLLKRVGPDHPDARKLKADRDREQKAVEIIRLEFEMDIANASRTVELKREQSVQAEEAMAFARRQVEKGTDSQETYEQKRLARDTAVAELEAANNRLALLQISRDKLFPEKNPDVGAPSKPAAPRSSALPDGPTPAFPPSPGPAVPGAADAPAAIPTAPPAPAAAAPARAPGAADPFGAPVQPK